MIRIITDSLCDLTLARARELNIDILPLLVRFGEEEYRCGIELTNEQFYEKLSTSPVSPTTAAVNPYEFEEIFERYLNAGDDVVAILFSRHMSATYQSAVIAAENIDSERLHLIDCENGAMGQTLLIETAAAMRDEDMTAVEIQERITALLPRTMTYIVIDTMEYLKRGGRISKSAALLGGLMKLHPVLQVVADGAKPVDKVKGKKSCNAWLINKLKEEAPDTAYKLVIGHSNAPERADAFRDQIREAGITNEVFITCIGPVVGTHIGPNCLGIGYIKAP
jgi:EDD domain protein, DegV family